MAARFCCVGFLLIECRSCSSCVSFHQQAFFHHERQMPFSAAKLISAIAQIQNNNNMEEKKDGELMKEAKEQSQPTIDGAKSDLKKLLQRFEDELGEQQYLLGDFSLVDADLIPRFTRLEGFGVLPDAALPRLGKYLERVKARPSVKALL